MNWTYKINWLDLLLYNLLCIAIKLSVHFLDEFISRAIELLLLTIGVSFAMIKKLSVKSV